MDMGHSKKSMCKISMLWNWYTVDSCFIARSWHVKLKGTFAVSCIGVFFMVVLHQWLHRFCREYDAALINRGSQKLEELDTKEGSVSTVKSDGVNPMVSAISHKWLFASRSIGAIYATPFEHITRSFLFTCEWTLAYFIMLLFMYYNGYIIISCILGAFVGRLLFTYTEPLNCSTFNDSFDSDRKCCP